MLGPVQKAAMQCPAPVDEELTEGRVGAAMASELQGLLPKPSHSARSLIGNRLMHKLNRYILLHTIGELSGAQG